MSDDRAEFGMVMPFVACVSNGGEYEDRPFAAGWQAGQIWAELAAAEHTGATALMYMVRTPLVKQLDLVGMHFGFRLVVVEEHHEHGVDGFWTTVQFVREGVTPIADPGETADDDREVSG